MGVTGAGLYARAKATAASLLDVLKAAFEHDRVGRGATIRPAVPGWTPAYRAAWSTFQHRLASQFDRDPLIRTGAVSSCSTLSDEPLVFSPNPALHAELFADGWSSTAQQQCLQGAFSDYSAWKQTPIEYTFNAFVAYMPGVHVGTPDLPFTNQLMTRCAVLRRTTGRGCILSNHALPPTAGTTSRGAPIYAEIRALYSKHSRQTSVDFQTFSPDTFGGL